MKNYYIGCLSLVPIEFSLVNYYKVMILTKYLLAVSVELLKTFITVTNLQRSGQCAVHHQECIFRKRFGKFHQYSHPPSNDMVKL